MKKTWLQKMVSISLALLMLLSLVACGSKTPTSDDDSDDKTPTYKEKVVIAAAETLSKYDPQSNNSLNNHHLYHMAFNTLVSIDYETGEISGELANKWTISEDGKVYTFELRDDVTFHDGTPFTADDVLFTLAHAAESSYQLPKVACIVSSEAVNEHTVKITLTQPNSEFLQSLSTPGMSIICKSAVEKDPENGHKIGTGAFMFNEWVPGDYVSLLRNDNFWGELPKTKEIVYREYGEASARVIALQTGEVDVCLEVPAVEVNHIAESDNCKMIQFASTELHYLGLNTTGTHNAALANQKVRAAINYATNTEELIIAVTEGYGLAPNGVLPSTVWGYNSNITAHTYDLEKAKALLAEAGYPDGIELSLTTNAAKWPDQYELLQAQWAKAGIKLTLATDDGTIRSQHIREKTYDALATSWAFSGTNLNNDLRSLWYSTSGSQRTLINDPYVDSTLDNALLESDTAKLEATYAELTQYLTDFAGFVPLYIKPALIGVSSNLEGCVFNANLQHDFTYAAVSE